MLITKSSLISCKESLRLAQLGYDLMDRKRIILMQELSRMMDDVKQLSAIIDEAYEEAYIALQQTNISIGSFNTQIIASQVEIETGVEIVYRSVMGIEIPKVRINTVPKEEPQYRITSSNSMLDETFDKFNRVKQLTVKLAEMDVGIYRLAKAIEKSRKRANALSNVVIPDLKIKIKTISDALEEKDREEFIRMKLVKKQAEKVEQS